ncbi:MAG TPA: hypothetical protein VMV46_21755 [Thermoanaerobaculia bacterium]|nr:hypothetical protein [Thermoanaerobaculia bacterium]
MHTDVESSADFRARHLRVGWWSLLAFLLVGLGLESLHALKAPLYLDASNETRRLLWRLAHAHGALLSVVHVVWATAGAPLLAARPERLAWASRCLIAGGLLLPLGFFLGGVRIHGGDPGIGVLLVPPGALLVAAAILMTAGASTAAPASAPLVPPAGGIPAGPGGSAEDPR